MKKLRLKLANKLNDKTGDAGECLGTKSMALAGWPHVTLA